MSRQAARQGSGAPAAEGLPPASTAAALHARLSMHTPWQLQSLTMSKQAPVCPPIF